METGENTVGSLSMLLVEDDVVAGEKLRKLLKMRFPGLHISRAADGKEGLDLFQELRHEIVLTDINLPILDGITMARHMRELKPDVHIIAVTAYTDTNFLMDAIRIGLSSYLLKPIDASLLVAAVQECLDRIKHERETLQGERLRTQMLETLGRLTGGVAHDFNNILTVVLGNIAIARFCLDDPEELEKRLTDVERAADRAKELTQQLLTVSRGVAPIKKTFL